MSQSHLWLCHWERIDGPLSRERRSSAMVWICEHPYRTIRQEGPGEDCAGCPVWDAMARADARARRKAPLLPAVTARRSDRGGHAA